MNTPSPFAILALALASALPIAAHHAWPITREKLVTVKGTVIDFVWANPHPMIMVDVTNANGATERWQIGGPALNRMEAIGWTRSTVKPGDIVTGIGYQFADGQKIIRLEKVVLPNGKEIPVYGR